MRMKENRDAQRAKLFGIAAKKTLNLVLELG